MDNIKLSRQADSIKTDLDYLIDAFISEIEELENENNKLKGEIESLNDTIERMGETINDLENN